MNYINRPKECYTQEEWIEYLEESIRELRKEKENLKKEKGEIRQRLVKLEKAQAELSRVKENKELIKENKKLNIKVASLEWEIKWLNSVIDKLKEENQTLELWLDRKEKLNKGYREDVDYRHHRAMVAERWWEDED